MWRFVLFSFPLSFFPDRVTRVTVDTGPEVVYVLENGVSQKDCFGKDRLEKERGC